MCVVLLLQEFFRCDYFTDVGAGGLLHKLHCAVERSLAGVDFGGSMSQQVGAVVICASQVGRTALRFLHL
jgi:hypothetical protein